jgi:hypothetical protein
MVWLAAYRWPLAEAIPAQISALNLASTGPSTKIISDTLPRELWVQGLFYWFIVSW